MASGLKSGVAVDLKQTKCKATANNRGGIGTVLNHYSRQGSHLQARSNEVTTTKSGFAIDLKQTSYAPSP
jgi:hypothetical protein